MNEQWQVVWRQFKKNKIGLIALLFFLLLFLVGLYAPLLASSKPLVVWWNKRLYFPLLRYLFYRGFYSKPIDLFYNILMFTLPLFIIFYKRKWVLLGVAAFHIAFFIFVLKGGIKDPQSSFQLRHEKQALAAKHEAYREDPVLAPIDPYPTWKAELKFMTPYAKLNELLRFRQRKKQHDRFAPYRAQFLAATGQEMATLWHVERSREEEKRQLLQKTVQQTEKEYEHALERLPELIAAYRPFSHDYLIAKYEVEQAKHRLDVHSDHPHSDEYKVAQLTLERMQNNFQKAIQEAAPARTPLQEARNIVQTYRDATAQLYYLDERDEWVNEESKSLRVLIPTLVRPFHWEDDAGGAQITNKYVPWWELTRINRKDLFSSLLFGIRVSLVVGISAVAIALIIGIPLGTISGYFAGKTDLIVCRIVEIWEAMPTFFMLLLVIAITQSKSIFLVIAVLGIFGWTSFCRFIRAEVLRQRSLPYVLATKSMGYRPWKIMFSHILPNAIPPILTLLPFSLMAAITSEAGLSFLGLGEEGSSSWGVLMDEGRSVFPGESYLLWPPAILLTLLLIAIALVGDVLRDALDPKLRT